MISNASVSWSLSVRGMCCQRPPMQKQTRKHVTWCLEEDQLEEIPRVTWCLEEDQVEEDQREGNPRYCAWDPRYRL